MAFVPDFNVGNILFDGERSVAMTQDLTSDIQVVYRDSLIAIQAIYTGSPSGSLKIEGSLDKTNWSDIPSTDRDWETEYFLH